MRCLLVVAITSSGFNLSKHGVLEVKSSKPGPPQQEISVEDVTALVQGFVDDAGLREGLCTVVSKHTTTGITINEFEKRLATDLRQWLLELAPPDARSVAATANPKTYLHNDIDQRPDGEAERLRCIENGWDIDDPEQLAKWRSQEPINAHSHLHAMLLGSTEAIPVAEGKLLLGQWQSIMLVDLDGPRDRLLGVSVLGFT
ncbi:hypothetical protein CTAYLR_000027 [Chrysophaeum taylorii]|uniref:Secondary thiamine-phosphate synthase enzyme n=1 Tax=Chrysophaeum taylorii TaxID=2483200 RepID=A0AAD7XN72_9STRA|nr:hypothetical protein CTAYLR_000027 [Chrysophaeum taylorii]